MPGNGLRSRGLPGRAEGRTTNWRLLSASKPTVSNLPRALYSRAEPDQHLVSNVVAELCIGKRGRRFQDMGEVSLKGLDRPIRVHPQRCR